MKSQAICLVSIGCLLTFCSNDFQNHPEKGGDKAISMVLAYNQTLDPLKGNDDTYYIHKGDSSLQAFDKQVITTPHVDREPDIGIRYTSRKNKWSYYLVRDDRTIYSVTYYAFTGIGTGTETPLHYRVNVASGVIEMHNL